MIHKESFTELRYDDGAPHFMTALNEWTEQRRPSWKCCYYGKSDLPTWFEENIQGEYDNDFRFNSGDPAYFITIYNKDDAALFKLTWG